MATLSDRVALLGDTSLLSRVRMALVGQCTSLTRQNPLVGGEDKATIGRALAVVEYARRVLQDPANEGALLAEMVISAAPNSHVDDGVLSDAELSSLVAAGIEARAGLVLRELQAAYDAAV